MKSAWPSLAALLIPVTAGAADEPKSKVPIADRLAAIQKDRPFALIGVNSDTDRETLKERTADEQITWRSFWNGPEGTDGPISRAWNVRAWPTVYVLDPKGVIRFKDIHSEELDQAVDQLLQELEGEGR